MLMKFLRETKAYTSIFLCLVLLPMVTYSSMIIDAVNLHIKYKNEKSRKSP